jgi:RNA polymerase sigma factor (sigma-70 family)
MPAASLSHVLHHLRTLSEAQATRELSDGELLERFRLRREETAFTLLVQRHGPMVLGVCRRLLGDAHAAEDAFQATFLVLVRKAMSIRKKGSVASWLHGVARRIAVKARLKTARDHALERQSSAMQRSVDCDRWTLRELRAVLDEELEHLPEKYRTPLVLCGLEGKTHEQAARELGCPRRSLSSRLARARVLLRAQLTQRGITVSTVALAAVLSEKVTAAVPALLAIATVRAAMQKTAGAIPTNVAALAEEGIKSTSATKMSMGLVLVLMAATVWAFAWRHMANAELQNVKPAVAPPVADGPQLKADLIGDPLPEGATRRIGTLRFRQGGGYVNRLLLTRDGKTLISKSYYGERSVTAWSFPSGKLLHQFPGHYDENRAVAVTPDGKTVATGQDAVISLWDLATGKEARRFQSPLGSTDGLAFSPDGKLLASGHGGHAVQLWDLDAGKVLAKLPVKHNRTTLLAFTPDGKTLATGDFLDKTIRLFDVAAPKERRLLERPSCVHDFAFSPDGSTLAAGGADGTIPLWDVATGKLLRELRGPGQHVRAVAWSPDGKTLATSEYQEKIEVESIRLWDVETGKEQRHVESSWGLVESLLFTADGKTLISGGRDSVIRLWNVDSGKERPPAAGNDWVVWRLALSPDGRKLAYPGRGGIVLWDVPTAREVGTLPGHHGSFVFSPDGKLLAGGSGVNALHLWDVADRRRIRTLAIDVEKSGHKWVAFRCVAFSADGKLLVSGADSYREGARRRDELIHLWDPATGKELRQLAFKANADDLDTLEGIALSPDGRTLAASGRAEPKAGVVRLWDLATGKVLPEPTAAINDTFPTWKDLHLIQSPIVEPRAVFSPDGWLLTTNCVEKSIFVWEAATGRERCRLEGHEGPTACVAFAPDGRTLASAGYDQTIRLWDVETGKELRKLTGHRGKANTLVFTPDGKTLISGSDDTTILFWDVAGVTHRARREARLALQEWEALWKNLAAPDAGPAHQAIARLTASPGTVAALKERLRAAPKVGADRLDRLLRDLDSEEFAVRENAARDLEKLGETARPAIERALASKNASPELRRRLEDLQGRLAVPAGEQLRELRALEVLEHVATPDAGHLLQALAAGAPEARLTREAAAACKRLEVRK